MENVIPPTYKHLTPFKRYVLQNFPFIEADFDALTNYGLLSKIEEYLNNVISSQNTVQENITELNNAYTELKSYVDNYFENLDVQEEINNKLDQMAEDGSLEDIFRPIIMPEIERQDRKISAIEGEVDGFANKLNMITNLNPVPVNNTSAMTDHTKIYLLTTTGHWYYWDSSQQGFVDGGVYQSAIADGITDTNIAYKGITPSVEAQFDSINLRGDQSENVWTQNSWGIGADGVVRQLSAGGNSVLARIPTNSFITIKRSVLTDRFRVGLITARPYPNDQTSVIIDDASKDFITFYSGSYCWAVILYTMSGETANIDVLIEGTDKLKNDIMPENMTPFVPVPAGTELYNPKLKLHGYGVGNVNTNYPFIENANVNGYCFALEKDVEYTISHSGGNAFRVTLWRDYPKLRVVDSDANDNYFKARPSKVVIDDPTAESCVFNSGNYKYCVITGSNDASDFTLSIKANKETHTLSEQFYKAQDFDGGVYVFNPEANALDSFWTMWNGRLAWGINTNIAPVPVQFDSQIYVAGTIIGHVSDTAATRKYNRHGMHVIETYGRDNYSRMTMLMDKHQSEFDNKPSFEAYYYTGANHNAASYGNFKIGSDVNKHSFLFSRDKMIASGVIDCLFPIELANINPYTDLDDSYSTVANADNAHEPEQQADANIKCLKWIYLHNARNGAMFYDSARNKLVVKINDQWQDVQTTPVPAGTYDF